MPCLDACETHLVSVGDLLLKKFPAIEEVEFGNYTYVLSESGQDGLKVKIMAPFSREAVHVPNRLGILHQKYLSKKYQYS